jgi:hypothetical protein
MTNSRSRSKLLARAAITAALFAVTGCAVVSSHRTNVPAPKQHGVSYYLPRKDAIVTLSIAKEGAPSYAVTPTTGYPDLSQRYVARYHQSLIGTDTLQIGVTPSGLLTTTNADFTSQLPTILVNLARAAAIMADSDEGAPVISPCPCAKLGAYSTYVHLGEPAADVEVPSICGVTIRVDPLGERPAPDKSEAGSYAGSWRGVPGFYYRQQQPYRMTIPANDACGFPPYAAIVFSPNDAPLELLRVERGLFANANASFVFDEGILTSYKQAKTSELAAISALPADMATAYFTALSSMFTFRSTALTSETNYEKTIAGLVAQQAKTAACQKALATGDAAGIEANCK